MLLREEEEEEVVVVVSSSVRPKLEWIVWTDQSHKSSLEVGRVSKQSWSPQGPKGNISSTTSKKERKKRRQQQHQQQEGNETKPNK